MRCSTSRCRPSPWWPWVPPDPTGSVAAAARRRQAVRADAGSIAAYCGSVSVVTFAVASTYLARLGVADTARAICTALRERYCDNYSMLMYVGAVDVLRPEKF